LKFQNNINIIYLFIYLCPHHLLDGLGSSIAWSNPASTWVALFPLWYHQELIFLQRYQVHCGKYWATNAYLYLKIYIEPPNHILLLYAHTMHICKYLIPMCISPWHISSMMSIATHHLYRCRPYCVVHRSIITLPDLENVA